MHRREFVLGAAGIVGATTIGSIAYTSASVERDVSATVSNDSTGIIGLNPNGSVSGITENNGTLGFSTSNLNTDGTFTYGDPSSAASTPAFTITNSGSETYDLEVSVSLDSSSPSGSNIKIELYGSGGSSIDTADVGSSGTVNGSTHWASGDSIYAIVKIVTAGNDQEKVSGTITFSATTP